LGTDVYPRFAEAPIEDFGSLCQTEMFEGEDLDFFQSEGPLSPR
jgi:hypothetical protein